ncbi:hypothetical protein [Mucilaginibacter sp.]|uniref:LGFP repeat-containing protein n=1 Tax=Mucilaginibacter sp. TaxID=1882438 RepID=UPI002851AF8B|nr:hypothetical protein [Mucilaginibacter sp.]MDR3693000.1 hypothetical protein [Mucilaginibacter sp.]
MRYLIKTTLICLLSFGVTCGYSQVRRLSRNLNEVRNNLSNASIYKSIQGKISITPQMLQQMQQEWQTPAAQIAGNKIQVQLWQVAYQADPNNNTTTILLQNKISAPIAYQLTSDGISYTIEGIQPQNNLAVIAFGPSLHAQPNLAVKGFPNDGQNNNSIHRYVSDAKNKLINFRTAFRPVSIVYGIYSIIPNQTDFQQVDFVFKNRGMVNCNKCDVMGDIGSFVSDVADGIAKAAKATIDATGDVVNNVGEAILVDGGTYFVQCFGTIATFLQSGELPKLRKLSDYGDAYNIANRTIFSNTLPPIDKIIVTNLMTIDKRQFTVPIKNVNGDVYILMNMGEGFNDPLNFNRNGFIGDVFIHELTHCWQIWHNDALRLCEEGAVNQFKNTVISNQYSYGCTGHNISDSYNTEQQAMIVQFFYDMLFYSPNGIFKDAGHTQSFTCGFEQQWVVQNILNNQPGNIDEQYTATSKFTNENGNKATFNYAGGVVDRTLAYYSNGNAKDGAGYYLPGKQNNSFYYYSLKTNSVTENGGAIRDRYLKEGAEHGNLGWPEINQTGLAGGAFQRFNHGHIYWTPKYGAVVVAGAIFDAWAKQNWEKGALGYPVSEYISNNQNSNKVQTLNRGGIQNFEHGFIELTVLAAMYGQTSNVTTNVHIYTLAEEIAHRNATPNMQVQNPVNNTSSGNTRFNNTKPVLQKPGTVNPGRQRMINPQPLPPKIIRQN